MVKFSKLLKNFTGRGKNRRILANGRDAEARVLSIDDTGERVNNEPVVNLSLRVRPSAMPEFTAEAHETVPVLNLPLFQPGKIVKVKYVPGTDQVAIVRGEHS
jgi:hypothetical protein